MGKFLTLQKTTQFSSGLWSRETGERSIESIRCFTHQGSLASLQKPKAYKHHQRSTNWKVRRRLMIWTKSARLKEEGLQVFVGILQGNLFWSDLFGDPFCTTMNEWSILKGPQIHIFCPFQWWEFGCQCCQVSIWPVFFGTSRPFRGDRWPIDDWPYPKVVDWKQDGSSFFWTKQCPHSGNVSSDVWRMGASPRSQRLLVETPTLKLLLKTSRRCPKIRAKG